MSARIGIITPTYERPELLLRLHQSLLSTSQSIDWQHYVVNDGSSQDYGSVVSQCRKMSGRFHYKVIPNAGVLTARNTAIDMALADGCTHLAFIDDDDFALPDSLSQVCQRIDQFPDAKWFIFPAEKDSGAFADWPASPTEMSWIDDIVLNRRLGSDNCAIVHAELVGQTRFSTKGRNQREWSFLLALAKKNDRIMVCPGKIIRVNYQQAGLSAQVNPARPSVDQVWNAWERSIRYWLARPFRPNLLFRAVVITLLTPWRLLKSASRSRE